MALPQSTDTEVEELEPETPETEQGEPEEPVEAEEEGEPEEPAEEPSDVVVTIGDEEPAQEQETAPKWVRELRTENRAKSRTIKELQEKVRSLESAPATAIEPLGARPKLEDFEFDQDEYDKAVDAWHKRKVEHDDQARKKQADTAALEAAWQAELTRYTKLRGELKVKDFAEAEEVARETFSDVQQNLIIDGCTNPALVVYALGRNEAKAKELAAIKSPAKFMAAVAKLEDKMKVTPRKAQTLPETPVKGTAPVSGTINSALERAREEARRTGDYNKVIEIQRKQAAAKKRA